MVAIKIKPTRIKARIPEITVDKVNEICKFTGLPRTKALGLMAAFAPVIKSGITRKLKNGRKSVKLIGEKNEWNFEI